MKIEIILYQKENGEIPIEDFLESMDNKSLQAKTLRTIKLLEHNGPQLREPYSKPLGDGIFELRTKVGTDISRVIYFFFVGKKAVLTNGFVKKSEKTPKSEIEIAKRYREDFKKRAGYYG